MKLRLYILALTGCIVATSIPLYADGIYTYLDENGKRVFTNILPQVTPTSDKSRTAIGGKPQRTAGVNLPSLSHLESSPEFGEKIGKLTHKYDLEKFNLGPEFVRAVIKVESNFNPAALSRKGAQGLMQLMPETARRYGVVNSFNPEQNLEGGIQYLRFLLDTFNGNVNLALAAYNAGENVVQRLKSIPPFPETRDYVRRVSHILGRSESIPLYDQTKGQVTYVAWVGGRLKFTNVDPPTSAVIFDGYHLPRSSGTP